MHNAHDNGIEMKICKIKMGLALLSIFSTTQSYALGIKTCESYYKQTSAAKLNDSVLPSLSTLSLLQKISNDSKKNSSQLKSIQDQSKSLPLERLHRPMDGYAYHSLLKEASNLKELEFLKDTNIKARLDQKIITRE